MKVVIAGGGRTAAHLAGLLLEQGHVVRIIEPRADVVSRLHAELPTEVIIEGHPTDPEVLAEAGPGDADVLAACMPEDADNLMLCYLARTQYGVRRTIAWITNPKHAWLFDTTHRLFHVDVALNQADIAARLLEEEMSLGDMMILLKLQRGRYSLVEEKLTAEAPAVGVAVRDLAMPAQAALTAIIRDGEMLLPRGDTVLAAGDEVLAMVAQEGQEDLARLFGVPADRPPVRGLQ